MKLERVLIAIIIIVLAYVAYTQYNSIAHIFNSKFLQGVLFKQEPRKTDAIKAFDKQDEVKEIMELTKLLHDVEKEVNDVYNQYDLIRINRNAIENSGEKGIHLLRDIKDLRQTINYDRNRIADLKRQIASYKSSNNSLNQIKKQYIKILESKDRNINNLQKRLVTLENEMNEKEIIIVEQAKVISDQQYNIHSQEEIINDQKEDILAKQKKLEYSTQLIEDLSVKHVILYARKETIHIELDGNSFYLQNKVNQLEIFSEHPISSYQIRDLEDGIIEFEIVNPIEFWNNNNYLLIRVKSRRL
jgi:DNA repair exonuclease SbcCD ATPase subunit